MKNKTALILFALTVLMFNFAYAGTTIEEIRKAMNEKYAYSDDIKSMKMEQVMTVFDKKDKITNAVNIFKKDDMMRMEISTDIPDDEGGSMTVGTTVILSDGKDMYMINPLLGKIKITGNDAKQYEKEDAASWWSIYDDDFTVAGEEDVEGSACYVLQKTDEKEKVVEKVYVDKGDLTVKKTEDYSGKDMMTAFYRNYKKIDGKYPMPYLIEMYSKEKLISTVEVKNVELNCELDDALFTGEESKSNGSINDLMKQFMKP